MALRNTLLSAFLTAGLFASPALAFQSQNNFTVRQIDSQRFEVKSRGGLGASDAWCAAGDFVISGLRLPRGTTVWRISEPPRPRGQSIVFSLSSDGAASTTGLVGSSRDSSLSASHGEAMCQSLRELQRNR